MSNSSNIKKALLMLCHEFVEARVKSAELSMEMAQASANEESKSSAGDKYETGRAMAQLEIEKGSGQLVEARKMRQALERVSLNVGPPVIQLGSLVYTNQGNYFVAVAAGQLTVNGVTWFAISPASPIGKNLKGLGVGDSFMFNQMEITIEKVS
jgi:transcription elongation GreA/GreB family factor